MLPFAAVRQTCGLKHGVRLTYFAIGPKLGIASVRPRMRHVVGRTRFVSPSSGRTVVMLGARTVFSVVSGLFAKVHVLV